MLCLCQGLSFLIIFVVSGVGLCVVLLSRMLIEVVEVIYFFVENMICLKVIEVCFIFIMLRLSLILLGQCSLVWKCMLSCIMIQVRLGGVSLYFGSFIRVMWLVLKQVVQIVLLMCWFGLRLLKWILLLRWKGKFFRCGVVLGWFGVFID